MTVKKFLVALGFHQKVKDIYLWEGGKIPPADDIEAYLRERSRGSKQFILAIGNSRHLRSLGWVGPLTVTCPWYHFIGILPTLGFFLSKGHHLLPWTIVSLIFRKLLTSYLQDPEISFIFCQDIALKASSLQLRIPENSFCSLFFGERNEGQEYQLLSRLYYKSQKIMAISKGGFLIGWSAGDLRHNHLGYLCKQIPRPLLRTIGFKSLGMGPRNLY